MSNELVLQPMDGELGELERAGIHEAQVLQTIEKQRKAEQDRKEEEEADANWNRLLCAIREDLPAYLYVRVLWYRDKEFTEDAVQWDVEIPLPDHRGSLVARYNRVSEPKGWKRVPLQGGTLWGVCRWVISGEIGEAEIVLSHQHLGYATDLKKALYLAYREGLRYHKLAGELEVENKARRERQLKSEENESPESPSDRYIPSFCTDKERRLLDSLLGFFDERASEYPLPREEQP